MVDELSPGDLCVWYRCTGALTPADIDELTRVLSVEERDRAARFAQWHDRRDFVAAHALLRQTLSVYGHHPPAAWQFASTERGKPLLVEPQPPTLAFSLSHTRGLVACATASGADVGVDVEPITDSAERRDLVAQHFSAAERRALAALPNERRASRFTELWTLKESYLKARGLGLQHPMDAFTIMFDAEDTVSLEGVDESEQKAWYFALAEPSPAFRLAVAVRWDGVRDRGRVIVRNADTIDRPPLPLTHQSPARD